MGHRAGSRRVGGGAFAWRRGGWCRGGARAQRVGAAGLVRCVEVARFLHGGLGSWWGLHAMAGIRCTPHWGGAWRGVRGAGWHRSRACTPCWDGVEAVSRRVLRTVTGWCQQTCAWRRGDIGQKRNEKKKKKKHIFTCVNANEAMGGEGIERIEGGEKVERWGFEDPACGEKRSLQWSEKKQKKEEKKHNFTCVPASAGNGGGGCGG